LEKGIGQYNLNNFVNWGAWLTQSGEHVILDLKLMSSGPTLIGFKKINTRSERSKRRGREVRRGVSEITLGPDHVGPWLELSEMRSY